MRKLRKKYSGPGHPWKMARIEEESALQKEYGLKNKREIWKIRSLLKNFANQAKKLIAATGAQADKEKAQLFARLKKLGLVGEGAKLDDVLGLTIKDLLERRIQTLVFRRGLAKTPGQARQFIVHRHILAGGKEMTAPSYLVPVLEQETLAFVKTSNFAKPDHPELMQPASKRPVHVPKRDDFGGNRRRREPRREVRK
jgi:small subunit ribosomal protein S4